MFADDTTIYCIGTSADEATAQLNLAMHELYSWCLANKLTPHPGKSEAMLISRKTSIGPFSPIFVGGHTIKWVIKTRLLGMTIDHKLSWVPHTLELKKSFVNKLCLLKNNVTGFLFEGYLSQRELWPYFMGCLLQLR